MGTQRHLWKLGGGSGKRTVSEKKSDVPFG